LPIPSPNKLARFPLLNKCPHSAIMEGVRAKPKTRRASRKTAAAGKARPSERPAARPRPVVAVPARPAPRAEVIPRLPAPDEGGGEEERIGKSQER